MIANASVSKLFRTFEIIELLKNSAFEFHLTGSYYFNTETSQSGFDFFAEDSEEIRTFISNINGFICTDLDDQIDNNEKVIIFANINDEYRSTIFIILVKNIDVKILTQESIKEVLGENYCGYGTPGRLELWKLAETAIVKSLNNNSN